MKVVAIYSPHRAFSLAVVLPDYEELDTLCRILYLREAPALFFSFFEPHPD